MYLDIKHILLALHSEVYQFCLNEGFHKGKLKSKKQNTKQNNEKKVFHEENGHRPYVMIKEDVTYHLNEINCKSHRILKVIRVYNLYQIYN